MWISILIIQYIHISVCHIYIETKKNMCMHQIIGWAFISIFNYSNFQPNVKNITKHCLLREQHFSRCRLKIHGCFNCIDSCIFIVELFFLLYL